jgi:parallel beta-helix repeat protein
LALGRTLIATACSLAAVATLPVAPAASASDSCDRVAAPNGSDSAPGTTGAPFRTAHKLVGSLGSGQTGCFRSGTYSWSGDLSIDTPGITVTSYPGEGATLAGRLRVEVTADAAVIEGLTLDGRNANGHLSPLIYADRVVLSDNEITNHRTSVCVHLDDYPGYPAPREVVISDNRIHDCGEAGTNLQHAIYLAQARDTVIRDNWIYRNADRGIQLYPNADGTRVTGNVIDSNGEGIIFGGKGSETSDDNLVKGNVITNSTVRYNVESYWSGAVGTGNVVRDNCVWTARDSYDGTPEGSGIQESQVGFSAQSNVVSDPRYVDRAAGDFTLREGSSCAAEIEGSPVTPDAGAPQAPAADPSETPTKGPRSKRRRVRLRSAADTALVGEAVDLFGRVAGRANLSHTRAAIQVLQDGRWVRVAAARINSNRRFTIEVLAGEEPSLLRFRATVRGIGRSRSANVRVLN